MSTDITWSIAYGIVIATIFLVADLSGVGSGQTHPVSAGFLGGIGYFMGARQTRDKR